MTLRALGRLFGMYLVLLVGTCLAVRSLAAGSPAHLVLESAWKHGELVGRAENAIAHDGAWPSDVTLVHETIVQEGSIITSNELAFAMSLVAGRDGVKATLDGKTVYVTPDDLLARQAYDHGAAFPALSLSIGADVPMIEAILAERLATTVPEVRARASIHRIRTERSFPSQPARIAPAGVTPELVRNAALDAARFLARGVADDGHFRYIVEAPTNRTLGGYDWPRHSGATYFLAQAYGLSHEPEIKNAVLRAAALLRERSVNTCGAPNVKCIGTDDVVDLGSSALALVAVVEIVRNVDATYAGFAADLTRFVMQQQRPDGEFMHQYDRAASHPIDIQFLYYSGEATLALARAYSISHDDAQLDAARRGLAHLVGPAWSFFGDRYYFGEEHWTCQAMADLWERAPDAKALDFCERWHAYGRRMMFTDDDSPFDADGAFGVGPLVTPRVTPVASRSEAAVATLDAAIRAHGASSPGSKEVDALDVQLHRSLAFVLRNQLRPGLAYLFVDPSAVYGAIPGSPVDWQLRIDYAQHAGSAMIRWLDVMSHRAK